ncbi:6268_t:CDS:2 [Paraglomus brasilianum]|uniref:Very-long-chain 3-oxoacyl-CoA reductase n=1 Tax=Paraglomus brasilianum TaxID=144538 RepID=A0A9N8VXZ7_9GLOM|nr:6268_t:CDS:2 [Paraglomus brasilianum]
MPHSLFELENKLATALVGLFSVVGALFLANKTLSFLNLLLDIYVRSGKRLEQFGAGKGAWAVITGASDGIGKEFAYQLAAAKFNILLISRTRSKLESLASEIEGKYGVQTQIYAMDFTKGDLQDYENLKEVINQLDIGVLINNVATNHEIPTPFIMESEELINNIVEVNIAGTLRITKMIVNVMAAKNRGLILNIGSFAGYVPSPYLSVYSGSKAFLSTWSQALGAELKPKGIVVQNVNTYFVVTGMSKIRRSNFLTPYPKPYVRAVLSKIGVPCGSEYPYTSASYPSHGLANWLIANAFSWSWWEARNLEIHIDVRKRALRKREREAAAAKSQ